MTSTSTEVPPQPDPDTVDSQPEGSNPATMEPFTADKSELHATVDQHRKKSMRGGKTGNADTETGMSTSVIKPEIPIPIPNPKSTVFRRDATNPAQDSKRFYSYWNQLPMWAKERTICYVYRDWPMLKPLAENSGEFVYIDKISGTEPLQDDIDLQNMYGSGSYNLMFNEQTPGSRNLCKVYVPSLGMSDMKSHPPVDRRISDINNVDMDFPGNKSYIEFLRMAGKLPEQQTGKVAEAEMANIALVDKLLERGDKAQESALEIAKSAVTKSASRTEPSDAAIDRAIGIVATGAERANKMVSEAYETIKATKSSEGSSVKETLELVTSIIAQFGPKQDGESSEVRELRAELGRIRDERMKSLEEELKAMRAAPIQAGNASPSATMKESITAFKEMRDLVEDVVGGGKKSPVEEIAEEAGIPKWLQLSLQYGLPVINNVLGLVMAGRGLTPMPSPPLPPIPGMGGMGGPGAGMGMAPPPGARPMPPTAPNPSQAPGTPGLPAPATQQSQPELTQNGVPTYGLHPDIADILFEQKTPIVQYLAAGDATGEDYAELFANTYGLPVFNMMAGFGKEALLLAITSFPPIMSRLGALSIGSDRLAQFAGEFCDFKPVLEDEEGEEGNGTGPGTTDGTPGAA